MSCEDIDKTHAILSPRSHTAALKSDELKIYNTRFGFIQANVDALMSGSSGLPRAPREAPGRFKQGRLGRWVRVAIRRSSAARDEQYSRIIALLGAANG